MSNDLNGEKHLSAEISDFMRESVEDRSDQEKFDELVRYPDFAVNRALYASNQMDSEELILLYQAAGDLRRAQRDAEIAAVKLGPLMREGKEIKRRTRAISNLNEWRREVDLSYPAESLRVTRNPKTNRRDKSKTFNINGPARSAYLFEAIKQLLLVVDAPEAMRIDFETLIGTGNANVADRRADVQKALLDHPEWCETKVATKTGVYHQHGMVKEIESGLLTDYRELRKNRSNVTDDDIVAVPSVISKA